MLFWNVSRALDSGRATLVNQHIVDANLECVVWSPFSSDRFVTCGENFCKVWRFQPNELLRSFSVKFPTGIRPHILSAAFISYKAKPFLFLGSQTGDIYRINVDTLATEETIKISESPVTSMISLSRARILLTSQNGLV